MPSSESAARQPGAAAERRLIQIARRCRVSMQEAKDPTGVVQRFRGAGPRETWKKR